MVAGMSRSTFKHHREAALALLCQVEGLSHRVGGFLGHAAVAPELTARQRKWLVALLERHGLAPLAQAD
jgi:hypothetical protein